MLIGQRPDWKYPQQRWVAWDEIANEGDATLSLNKIASHVIGDVHAYSTNNDHLAQWVPQTAMICQRWIGNGLLLQRILTGQGCFDQVLNAYTGWIVSRKFAPCNRFC